MADPSRIEEPLRFHLAHHKGWHRASSIVAHPRRSIPRACFIFGRKFLVRGIRVR
jgi:hypothetical protein